MVGQKEEKENQKVLQKGRSDGFMPENVWTLLLSHSSTKQGTKEEEEQEEE